MMSPRTALPIALAVCVLMTSPARPLAQTPNAQPRLQFEVASIKPNASGDFRRSIGPSPGGFSAMNVTLRALVAMAYEVSQDLASISVIGGPSWTDSDHFDVDARTGVEQLPLQQIRQMVRELLADRFQLQAHRETRERDVYGLVLADSGRRLGPRLKAATYNCNGRVLALARKQTPPPLPPPDAGGRRACSGQSRPGSVFARGFEIDWLADTLTPVAGRVVFNRTGLEGGFDFDLEWTPEQASLSRPDSPERIDPNGPSLVTALREQLGLKLDSQRAPVDVVVIDSAAHPTPN